MTTVEDLRSTWQYQARMMRRRGMGHRDIAEQIGKPVAKVKSACSGVYPGADLGRISESLMVNFGIRVHQVERQSWPSVGGQPYPVKISLPFISIMGEEAP